LHMIRSVRSAALSQERISHEREKLINAIVYFLRETNHCHTLKLFKLLNFADFEHFRQTGRTIFGLEYHALPKGPVPTRLFDEIKRGGSADLQAAINLCDLKPRVEFDKSWFTKRELKVLNRIAEFFRDLKANDMSEFSNENKKPWTSVYQNGKGKNQLIPPDLVFQGAPLMHEVPRIASEELEYRRELLRDTA
jgi:uncharacterized phage-associated protein